MLLQISKISDEHIACRNNQPEKLVPESLHVYAQWQAPVIICNQLDKELVSTPTISHMKSAQERSCMGMQSSRVARTVNLVPWLKPFR